MVWLKGEQPTAGNELIKTESNYPQYKLVIESAQESDQGAYTFKATSELGAVDTSCNVTVTCAPVYLKNLEPNYNCVLGSDNAWTFEIKARPAADFKIFKDNKEVKQSDKLLITKVNVENTADFSYQLVLKKSEAGRCRQVQDRSQE